MSHLRKADLKNAPISIDDESTGKLIDVLPDRTDLQKEFQRQELAEMIKNALGEIPDKYREVIVLYYFEEKSYKEISDILRCSVNSVSVLLNRAKMKLKEKMKFSNQ